MVDASTPLGFGAWLFEEGVLTSEQLQEALQCRSVYGGRLGTNLVEVGYLGLDELAELLTRYHGLTLAPVAWLEAPDPKALQIVPMALIRRHKLLPLRLEREGLHVAMLDPGDPYQLDHIQAAANRPAVPYVLPEIRILYWLETHLQIDRHPRFMNLAARLRRTDLTVSDVESNTGRTLSFSSDGEAASEDAPASEHAIATPAEAPAVLEQWFLDDEARAGADFPPSPEPAPQEPDPGPDADADEEAELLLEELVVESETPAVQAPEVSHGPVTPARVAELEALLAGACERDRIVELLLELARAHCEAAVLFVVQGGQVKPFRASGLENRDQLGGIEVPLTVHSVFSHPAVTGFPFRGAPPEGGIDARLLEGLGRSHIQDLVVHPIGIRGRVFNLLYCDNGANSFGESSVAALAAVADCAARAYERLILDRKKAGA